MPSDPKFRWITLKGYAVHSTAKAVRWRDEATGNELWFPLSKCKFEGKDLKVPERMYRQKLQEAQREEHESERQAAIDDAKDDRELQRDLASIDRKYGPTKKGGCLTMLFLPIAILIAIYKLI